MGTVYLHLGWPKTGTTSLQRTLAGNRDLLASAGKVYPKRWSHKGDDSHNGMVERLREPGGAKALALELLDQIGGDPDGVVLLSSESLTSCTLSDEECGLLLDMLAALRQRTPVVAIWTLRRLDDAVHSLYVQMLLAGIVSDTPERFMQRVPHARMFANMRRIEEAVDGQAVYVKYQSTGAHDAELLRAFGLTGDVRERLVVALRSSGRLNASRSHKQLAAAINAAELSERSGVQLTRQDILWACDSGGFGFGAERPCELVGTELRRRMHDQALESASGVDFTPYVSLFGEDEIPALPNPRAPTAAEISDRDLQLLVDRVALRSEEMIADGA